MPTHAELFQIFGNNKVFGLLSQHAVFGCMDSGRSDWKKKKRTMRLIRRKKIENTPRNEIRNLKVVHKLCLNVGTI